MIQKTQENLHKTNLLDLLLLKAALWVYGFYHPVYTVEFLKHTAIMEIDFPTTQW